MATATEKLAGNINWSAFGKATELKNRLSSQKGINVQFDQISDANHFFTKSEESLKKSLNKYISKESALF